MGKLFRWGLVVLIAALVVSKLNIQTSIYKKDDNSVEIIFPQWQQDDPWFYLFWTPGTLSLDPNWRDKVESEYEDGETL
ncbi:hypothetical protein ACFOSS_06750 [Pseudaeromonas sharmana]|uniref:Uncharacterized protein n=1 Tax=Pseudaeromonas sharmana TaxID=328412 RepID=A0ABV8CM81_9GAMM